MNGNYTPDPKNFAEMAVPFENDDAAELAIESFNKELSDLRRKYNLRDVLVIINDTIQDADGTNKAFFSIMRFGESSKHKILAAYAYGKLEAEEKNAMGKLLSGK